MVLYWRRYGRVGGCQIICGGVAQLGEHLPCKQGVVGSNPFISIRRKQLNEKEPQGEFEFSARRFMNLSETKLSLAE